MLRYSEERVNETVKELLNQAGAVEVTIQKREPYKVTEEMMKDADWKTVLRIRTNGSN